MATDVIYRSGGLVLRADTNEKDPGEIFMAECRKCSATSHVVDDNRLLVEVWTVNHSKENPGHQQYRLTTDTFWAVGRAGKRL
ncbi:hypothetical protein ACIQBJ_32040 [Kitasatospora sp. NPDC088391]|uniref:DUF7848 domain-containing protein n=1 Tax=Kitasatospora sp. NPDC088391 TaxID=3364074 RepID=UPI00381F01D1